MAEKCCNIENLMNIFWRGENEDKRGPEKMVELYFQPPPSPQKKTASFGHILKKKPSHSIFGAWSFLLVHIWLIPGEGPKGFVNWSFKKLDRGSWTMELSSSMVRLHGPWCKPTLSICDLRFCDHEIRWLLLLNWNLHSFVERRAIECFQEVTCEKIVRWQIWICTHHIKDNFLFFVLSKEAMSHKKENTMELNSNTGDTPHKWGKSSSHFTSPKFPWCILVL